MHVTVTPVQRVSVVARRQVEAAFECLGAWSSARSTTVIWQD
jgi:hypothetical protein